MGLKSLAEVSKSGSGNAGELPKPTKTYQSEPDASAPTLTSAAGASPQSYLASLKAAYDAAPANTTLKSLLYSKGGTGKTHAISTHREPILVDSFDPGGSKTLGKFMSKKQIFIENVFEQETNDNVFAFAKWRDLMNDRKKAGVFNHIGTYALDSITTWSWTIMNFVLKAGGRLKSPAQLQDWSMQMKLMEDWLHEILALPCNVVVTGHITMDKDSLSGKIYEGLAITGRLQERVPVLFDEVYMMEVSRTGSGTSEKAEYSFLTVNDRPEAKTRLGGGGIFQIHEKADFTHLLKKLKYPTEPVE